MLKVERFAFLNTCTIGRLLVDGHFQCYTLEPRYAGLSSEMAVSQIAAVKAGGKCAIPTGTYKLDLQTVSPRFAQHKQYAFCGGKLPRLQGVKGFEGVLIHIGNTVKDTDGCVLVGDKLDLEHERILNSTSAFGDLMRKLAGRADEKIAIE